MKWFGKDWGAPVCKELEHVELPKGKKCYLCNESFMEGDCGVVLPYLGEPHETPREVAAHLECFGDSIVPSKEEPSGG